MEILATDGLLRRAREVPTALGMHVRGVTSSPMAGGARATELTNGLVLGWSLQGDRLALWYLVEADEAARPAELPPFLSLSKAELRALGVDDALAPAIRRLRSPAALAALELPGPVFERLRFVLIQRANGLPGSEADLRHRAADLPHFDRYLHGDLVELLLNLDATQRRIVELGGPGPILVRGVAGSGKTSVALHRVFASLRQRSLLDAPRVLFLTYNRSLASFARELLVSMGLRAHDVEVATLHRWCWSYAASGVRLFRRAADRRALLSEACSTARGFGSSQKGSAVWAFPPAFWEEEIHRIKGLGIDNEEAYLDLVRFGAGRALDVRMRRHVWRTFQAYMGLQRERGVADWDDVVRAAYDKLRREGAAGPRYDQVLVDEAQDLTAVAMRTASALCDPRGTLLVACDPAQSIYEKGFRWKHVGVEVHGSRSFLLARNYRNTEEILAVARPLLAAAERLQADSERQGVDAATEIPPVRRRGAAPEFVAVPRGLEAQEVARRVVELVGRERVPLRNIAVLGYPNSVCNHVRAALEQVGVAFQCHDDRTALRLADSSAKVLPLKSSKGLEFPVVFLVATGADFRPPVGGDVERNAWNAQMARCFYVAMTRAMSRLVVVYARDDPAPFLRPALARVGDTALPLCPA